MRCVLICSVACCVAASLHAGESLVVHEWGTFTALQGEDGRAIGGINVDTERLPAFVHNFAPMILPNATATFQKGLPTTAPRLDVTMRLETPVIYFHLPAGAARPVSLDLNVQFRGGWLTQFYPNAIADIDGAPVARQPLSPMPPASGATATRGGLAWNGLRVGTKAAGPATNARVWLAPRIASAESVTTATGESEQYLFYRGVGNVAAPLKVIRSGADDLVIQRQPGPGSSAESVAKIARLWLVDVKVGGALAYRVLGPLASAPESSAVRTRDDLDAEPHPAGRLESLKQELREALVADGLFADEADGLLMTWETSYFKEPGLRLFFLVPRAWTDAQLPLKLSVPATIKRTMVGRIEIVSRDQRRVLQEIARVDASLPERDYMTRCSGLYARLGRFANALLLDEAARHPTPALTTFIRRMHLEAYQAPAVGQASVVPDASLHMWKWSFLFLFTALAFTVVPVLIRRPRSLVHTHDTGHFHLRARPHRKPRQRGQGFVK